MSKNYFLGLVLIFGFIAHAQVITFPDANFKARLMQSSVNTDIAVDSEGNFIVIDANGDNEIEVAEALAVYHMDLQNSSITSLTGIENFTNLRWLNCSGNIVSSLTPLSGLINLNGISCMGCGLTSLAGIEQLPHLQSIFFSGNPLISVNLQNLPELWRIWGWNTTLTELNLCGTQVRFLWVNDNPNLTSLYLKNGVVSSDLARSANQVPPPLHNFDFSNNPQLTYICYDEGELPAVLYGINNDTIGRTLTTACDNSCALGTQFAQENVSLVLYPNPATHFLQIASNQPTTINEVIIYNTLGQKMQVVQGSDTINVSRLAKGSYVVTIETANSTITQHFIKM